MEAARRFDPERNVKFITYAVWWIRQAVTHALSVQTRAFSLPQKLSGVAARLAREVAELDRAARTARRRRARSPMTSTSPKPTWSALMRLAAATCR